MLDQGYGDGDLSLRLHQLKFYLRAVLNAILDHKMHCANMTDEEAMKLLVERGFQTEGEAVGKVARAKQSSTQLSTYFVGRTAFYRLRQDVQRKQGDAFDLGEVPRGGAEPRHAAGEVPAGVGEVMAAQVAGTSRSARTASSVSLAAVTPMRSKHSATMLFGVVKRVMSRSIGVTWFAAAVGGSLLGVAQEADDVVGEELAVQEQRRDGFAVLLKEQFAELVEQAGKIGPESRGPLEHAGVRRGQQAHEQVRRANAVPVGGPGVGQRLAQHPRGLLVEKVRAEPAAGQENVVHVSTRFRRGVW